MVTATHTVRAPPHGSPARLLMSSVTTLSQGAVESGTRGAKSERWQVLAGAIGNILEWYDFAVYGYFAAALAKTFFPLENAALSLASTFGVFAAAFLVRP